MAIMYIDIFLSLMKCKYDSHGYPSVILLSNYSFLTFVKLFIFQKAIHESVKMAGYVMIPPLLCYVSSGGLRNVLLSNS